MKSEMTTLRKRLQSSTAVMKKIEKFNDLQKQIIEFLDSLPQAGKDCECGEEPENSGTFTYADWDFSAQHMIQKRCLKCGGDIQLES